MHLSRPFVDDVNKRQATPRVVSRRCLNFLACVHSFLRGLVVVVIAQKNITAWLYIRAGISMDANTNTLYVRSECGAHN